MNEQDLLQKSKMIKWLNSKKTNTGMTGHKNSCDMEDHDSYAPCSCGFDSKSKDDKLIEEIKRIILKTSL